MASAAKDLVQPKDLAAAEAAAPEMAPILLEAGLVARSVVGHFLVAVAARVVVVKLPAPSLVALGDGPHGH